MHLPVKVTATMLIKTLRYALCASLLLLMFIDPWNVGSDQPPRAVVRVENNERIGRNEARFRVSVTNSSGVPVFLTGIIYESGPPLYPVYLEQKRVMKGWQIVVPCIDTPPPRVIRLDSAVRMVEDLALKVPLEGVCKERDLQIEGKFRFRVDYFESEAQARLYLKKFFSNSSDKPHAAVALSEPFEIPPFGDPTGARPNH